MVSGSGMPNEGCEFSAQFRETVADSVAQCFSVDSLAFQSRFGGLHNRAHLLDGVRAGFGDGLGDGRVHFGLAGAGRKIRFDDGEFFGFFFGEFRAVAFGELVDRFFSTSLCLMAALIPRRTLRRSSSLARMASTRSF